MKDLLSNSLFHSTKGQYFTDTKVVGIDFIGNLFESGDVASTLIHETVHVFLCNSTEMGIVFTDVEKNAYRFTNTSRDAQKDIVRAIFNSQQMLQEGYSTFMQFAMIRNKLSRKQQDEWLRALPDSYRRWVSPFLFSFKLPIEQREKINLLVTLAMNTHIRKDAERLGLLDDPQQLKEYLADENNNPSIRIKKMLKVVKNNPELLNHKIEDIPRLSGINFFEPTKPLDVASFINYLNSRMGIQETVTAEQIGGPLSIDQIFSYVQDHTIVADLNINLAENAVYLYSAQDVVHYKDNIKTIIALYHDEKANMDTKTLQTLKPDQFDEEPELTLILQLRTGEKYLYSTSLMKAAELLNNELSKTVLTVKFADYNLADDKIYWLSEARSPDLVIFNHHWQMQDFLSRWIDSKKNIKFDYCHIGLGMLNVLLVKNISKTPLLTVNIAVPAQARKVVDVIKPHSNGYSDAILEMHSDQLNSHLVLWSGLDYRVNWVDMLIKESHHVGRD